MTAKRSVFGLVQQLQKRLLLAGDSSRAAHLDLATDRDAAFDDVADDGPVLFRDDLTLSTFYRILKIGLLTVLSK